MRSTQQAVTKVEAMFKQYDPASPFNFNFADTEYAKKFADEERIGKLAGFFTVLAIFISCMGLFGMASFMAEQRIREIGVRKVLGASVTHLWGLMSKEFVVLVSTSLLISMPLGWIIPSEACGANDAGDHFDGIILPIRQMTDNKGEIIIYLST